MIIVDLDFERKKRELDCMAITPDELMRLALDDLQNGDYPNAKKCLLLIVEEDAEGRRRIHPYRSGVTRPEEVGFLSQWQFYRMRAWEAERE
jgi:hypothetical protein